MLAQNFKTVADLGIKDTELDALVKVLRMLERDELRHVEVKKSEHGTSRPVRLDFLFNMDNLYTSARSCGTAACIAGTADLFFGSAFIDGSALRRHLPEAVIDLFCPNACGADEWQKITTEQAAIALRSYLTTGDANWAEALA